MEQNKKTKIKKIIQIIYNILSAVFIGFVCFGLCLSSCSSNDEQAPRTTNYIYESKSKRNYFTDAGYSYIGISDISSYQYFLAQKDLWKGLDNICNTGISYSNFILGTPVTINVSSGYFYIGDFVGEGEFDFTTAYKIDTIYFQVDSSYDDTDVFTMKFTSLDTPFVWCFTSMYFYKDINKTDCCSTFVGYRNSDPSRLVSYINTGFKFNATDLAGIIPSLQTYNESFQTYFDEQVYKNGFDIGYGQGYNKGYYDASDSGALSNPFTLIGSAFSGMASILSIELFPNFSLGLLVFIPVILAIVFVVVKSIKG